MVSRGAINGVGGCMSTGGICIGCTMPGFPDKFAPFYKAPPGSGLSGMLSRMVGSLIRPLRRMTQKSRDRSPNWQGTDVPSGWGKIDPPNVVNRVNDFFYEKLQYAGSTKPGKGQEKKS
jgi:hydrogenase small subunit